jgi:hypothetical protein
MPKRLIINEENGDEIWWHYAQQDSINGRGPREAIPLIEDTGCFELTLSDSVAYAIWDWAANLPGWDNGPHPLLIEDA